VNDKYFVSRTLQKLCLLMIIQKKFQEQTEDDANIDVLKNIFWTYDFNLKRSLLGKVKNGIN
jgi:hypothetical protein